MTSWKDTILIKNKISIHCKMKKSMKELPDAFI